MPMAVLDIIPAASFASLQTQWWQPDPHLQRWIQCIWTTSSQSHNPAPSTDKLYPDAGASLIIEHRERQADCFFFYNTETIQHTWSPAVNRLCVRLKPGATAQLLQPDLLEMTNVLIPVNDQRLPGIGNFLENSHNTNPAIKVKAIQSLLLRRTTRLTRQDNRATRLVASLHDQVTSPYTFAAEQGMSRRTLERSLRREIGISPKQLHEFNRIRKARRLLIESPLALSEIALLSGYYDQAHFTNAFHSSTQETPARYRLRKVSQFSKAEN